MQKSFLKCIMDASLIQWRLDYIGDFRCHSTDNLTQPETCHVVRVTSISADIVDNATTGLLQTPTKGLSEVYELPTCPVCLERMDSAVTGLVTVPCSHTFHCQCLSKWGDSRYYSRLYHLNIPHNLAHEDVPYAGTPKPCSHPILEVHIRGALCHSRPRRALRCRRAHPAIQRQICGSALYAGMSVAGDMDKPMPINITLRPRIFMRSSWKPSACGITRGTAMFTD